MATKSKAKRGKNKKQKKDELEDEAQNSAGSEGGESEEELDEELGEEEEEEQDDLDDEEEELEEEQEEETPASKSERQKKIDKLKAQVAELEAGRPKPTQKVKVKVYANKTGFDGIKRIRRGSLFIAEVWQDPETGEPILAKWMSTPKEWKEIQRMEREQEEQERQKKGIRGGATGFVEL